MIKIKDIFKNWFLGEGIFHIMGEMFDLPWEPDFDNDNVDIDYFGTFGTRAVAPFVLDVLEHYTGRVLNDDEILVKDNDDVYVVSNQGIYQLAKILWRRYGKEWTDLYKSRFYDYNPIENYNMSEESTDSKDFTKTTNGTSNNKIKSSNISTTSNNITSTSNDEMIESNQGFNSSTFKNTNKKTDSTDLKSSSNTDGSITNDSNSDITNENNETSKDVMNHTSIKKGNVGVSSTQNLIKQQREVLMFDYFNKVYNDVNKVLTCPTYVI